MERRANMRMGYVYWMTSTTSSITTRCAVLDMQPLKVNMVRLNFVVYKDALMLRYPSSEMWMWSTFTRIMIGWRRHSNLLKHLSGAGTSCIQAIFFKCGTRWMGIFVVTHTGLQESQHT